jgi:hypothetical protein
MCLLSYGTPKATIEYPISSDAYRPQLYPIVWIVLLVLACCSCRICTAQFDAALLRDLPENAIRADQHPARHRPEHSDGPAVVHAPHVLLADDAVRGPEQDPCREPLEHRAAPADRIRDATLAGDGAHRVRGGQPRLVRQRRVCLEVVSTDARQRRR